MSHVIISFLTTHFLHAFQPQYAPLLARINYLVHFCNCVKCFTADRQNNNNAWTKLAHQLYVPVNAPLKSYKPKDPSQVHDWFQNLFNAGKKHKDTLSKEDLAAKSNGVLKYRELIQLCSLAEAYDKGKVSYKKKIAEEKARYEEMQRKMTGHEASWGLENDKAKKRKAYHSTGLSSCGPRAAGEVIAAAAAKEVSKANDALEHPKKKGRISTISPTTVTSGTSLDKMDKAMEKFDKLSKTMMGLLDGEVLSGLRKEIKNLKSLVNDYDEGDPRRAKLLKRLEKKKNEAAALADSDSDDSENSDDDSNNGEE